MRQSARLLGYDCSDHGGGDYQNYQHSGLLEYIKCEKKADLDLVKRDVRERTNPERTDVPGSGFGRHYYEGGNNEAEGHSPRAMRHDSGTQQ